MKLFDFRHLLFVAVAALGFNTLADGLPDGYQRVEYIESTGQQLALTGLHATDDLVTRIGIMYKTNGGQWHSPGGFQVLRLNMK